MCLLECFCGVTETVPCVALRRVALSYVLIQKKNTIDGWVIYFAAPDLFSIEFVGVRNSIGYCMELIGCRSRLFEPTHQHINIECVPELGGRWTLLAVLVCGWELIAELYIHTYIYI